MLESLLLYLSIGGVPVWMAPLHAVCQRLLQTAKPHVSVQVSALITLALVNLIYVGVLMRWPHLLSPEHSDWIGGWLFVVLAVNAMAFFYFQLVNIATTSIHMAVLLRIYWAGHLSQDALLAQYGRTRMVEERVRRLVQLGQIETTGNFIRLRSRTLIFLSTPVYLWRRVLRLAS